MNPPTLLKQEDPPLQLTASPTQEARLTHLERRVNRVRREQREMRAMLGTMCTKVDDLCDAMKPVAQWVNTQIAEETKDAASWRESIRIAKRDIVSWAVKLLLVLAASAMGIGWLAGGGS